MRRHRLHDAAAAILFAVAALAGGCTVLEGNSASGPEIALLLPEAQTSRYETHDRPIFEARIEELCPECRVVYSNANQDTQLQHSQAESALARGVAVLVLDPVDSVAAASIVSLANARNVPVIAYDRYIESADLAYYVSFDNYQVGRLQSESLIATMEALDLADGGILVLNGSPTDHNARDFQRGSSEAFAASQVDILATFDTPGWLPSEAQQWTAGQVIRFGDQINGVYAANDGIASGAIAAFKAAGVSPIPPVTGQDADLTAIQRIVAGDQHMTIYKAIRVQATLAANVAVALINDQPFSASTEVDGIPADLLDPMVVTRDTIMETVVADGFYSVKEICIPALVAACEKAGIG